MAFLAVTLLGVAFLAVAFLAVAFRAVAFRGVAFFAVAFFGVAFFAAARFDGAVRFAGAAFFAAFAMLAARLPGVFAAVAPVARRVAVATFFAAAVPFPGAFFAPVAFRAAAGLVVVRVLPPRPSARRLGWLLVDRIGPARRASAISAPPRPAVALDRVDVGDGSSARPDWPGRRPGQRPPPCRSGRGSCLPSVRAP
ncbi:hypothetical protein I0C86_35810 [Plantactinospora sp. S1510]|uniref:Uncharacterized protein n=1 Tax=Plantactinospora alkalitolerans TaxID=2789879 RepID=A0ABS0H717_9ACTN|nr:hypothetical protein [Plantactinospora alkalitolerans]MBF9134260.1 hypothetical protein [Plantactinospora alkalitolerans]